MGEIIEDSWRAPAPAEREQILKVLKERRRRELITIFLCIVCIVLCVVFLIFQISIVLTTIFVMLGMFALWKLLGKSLVCVERESLIRATDGGDLWLSDVVVVGKDIRRRGYRGYSHNGKSVQGHSQMSPFLIWTSGVEEAGRRYDFFMGVDAVSFFRCKTYERGYIIRYSSSGRIAYFDYIPCA